MQQETYIVGGTKVVRETKEEEFVATSRQEAVEKFKEMFPGHPVDYVESPSGGWEIIGQDEGTGEYIFYGDDYVCDENGESMALRKNLPPDGE